jgi:hypothetical protein
MKPLSVLLFLAIAGCADQPALEELEEQALASGDWTEVEDREQLLQRRRKTQALDCPDGFRSVCLEQAMVVNCKCVNVQPLGRLRAE